MSKTNGNNGRAQRRDKLNGISHEATEAAGQFFASGAWTPQREAEWEAHHPRDIKFYLRHIKRCPIAR